jgi:NitT/TauT family transport system substrate-binding protein
MRGRRLVEQRVPGVAVEWVEQTDNRTGPIGEALVAGRLDVGSGGPAVFFQGWDRGFAWKTAGALCTMPLYLVANRPELRTLKDFGPGDAIALPALGGNQHVFLQMWRSRSWATRVPSITWSWA